MTETSPPYGDQPAPSARISEARLLEIEAEMIAAAAEYHDNAVEFYPRELIEEIRRYRAMLIGLAGPPGSQPYCCACVFCNNSDPGEHNESCPWPALEAEVKAILAERKP